MHPSGFCTWHTVAAVVVVNQPIPSNTIQYQGVAIGSVGKFTSEGPRDSGETMDGGWMEAELVVCVLFCLCGLAMGGWGRMFVS